MSRWARNRVYIVRSNIPKILYSQGGMDLMQDTVNRLTAMANNTANAHTGRHGYSIKQPYVGYIVHGNYTPLGIIRTRTKNGVRDNARHDTLAAVVQSSGLKNDLYKHFRAQLLNEAEQEWKSYVTTTKRAVKSANTDTRNAAKRDYNKARTKQRRSMKKQSSDWKKVRGW